FVRRFMWSISSGQEKAAWVEHYYEVHSIAFSPDGAFIASASRDTSVKVKKSDGWEKSISLTGHMGAVYSVAFSPGGTYLASGSEDMRVLIWETKGWSLKKTLDEHRASVTEVAFSPTGRILATASLDGKVFFFDTKTWVKSSLPRGDERKKVHSLAFSPQRVLIACGLSSGEVELWDVTTRTIFRIVQSHKGKVNALSFSPDGSRLFTGGEDGVVRIWDPQTGALIKTLERASGEVMSLCSSRDGRLCAAGNADGTIRIWSIERLFPAAGAVSPPLPSASKAASGVSADEALAEFEAEMSQSTQPAGGSSSAASTAASAAASTKNLSTSQGAVNIVWPDDDHTASMPAAASLQTGGAPQPGSALQPAPASGIAQKIPMKNKAVRVFEGHPEGAECSAFSVAANILVVGCGNGEIKFWSLGKAENAPLQVIKKARRSLIDSVGEKLLETLTALHIFYPDDTTTVKGDGKLEGHFGNVSALYFSMNDTRLITASCDGQLISWHYPIKDGTRNVFAYNSEILCAALSPMGSVLALGSRKEVVLLDYENGVLKKKAILDIEDERANGVAFSPGGKILACAVEKGLVELWDVKSASLQSVLKGHKARVSSVSFSPDGKTLASGSLDGTVKLWDVKAGLERVSVKGDEKEGVLSVEFHPREALLLSGGFDGIARLWDARSGRLLSLFEGHSARINEISFSSDGGRCATCGEDDKVLLWNIPQ
ncbi:MAG: WD40 repeat domain-containing protein, partial [Vulcanimicrobiota bacterium]